MNCFSPDAITLTLVCAAIALCVGILVGLYFGTRPL